MKLYLIRHGETQWNKQRLLQGRTDMPLNENGRQVASMTAEGLRDITFHKVYSSPLSRAYEMARLVTEGRYPIQTDQRLTEISFGIYEGLCCGRDGYNIPDPDFINFFQDPGKYVPPEGGESVQELCHRTMSFLTELAEDPENQGKTILISTHGASLRSMLVGIQKKPLSEFWQGGVHRNCGVTILSLEQGVYSIQQENVIYYDEALSTNYD